ncbi:hypothetical protein SERLA73DRAFT_143059, partial [Serpula lacrymans var. lacrymans S7.3]
YDVYITLARWRLGLTTSPGMRICRGVKKIYESLNSIMAFVISAFNQVPGKI